MKYIAGTHAMPTRAAGEMCHLCSRHWNCTTVRCWCESICRDGTQVLYHCQTGLLPSQQLWLLPGDGKAKPWWPLNSIASACEIDGVGSGIRWYMYMLNNNQFDPVRRGLLCTSVWVRHNKQGHWMRFAWEHQRLASGFSTNIWGFYA